MEINRWETINEEYVGNYKIFDLYYYTRVHPAKKTKSKFVALKSPNWVNILPITTDKHLVLVEQYRHGSDNISLEIPAGLIEHGEYHQNAAERECTEETGYVGEGRAQLLGYVEPNPAFLGNRCYHYVWFGCQKKLEQKLDENELINIKLLPLREIKDLIFNGTLRHSLVLSAILFFNVKFGEIWNF
jgi:8-oxo-dGTP pyrophosphatase MutT (NUDIX family)